MTSFARNLRQLRKESGMTQDQLAEKLNVTRQAVSAWERDRTQPDVETLLLLAQALGVEVNELLAGRTATPKTSVHKSDLIIISVSFAVSLVILFLQLTLYPYLLKLLREQWLPYAVPYGRIVPPIGFFAGGVFLASLASLFWGNQRRLRGSRRWILIALSVAFCLPSLLVMIDEAAWLFTQDLPVSISAFLIICCARHPGLSVLLFDFCPFFAGILASLGRAMAISNN